jgi:hypothetical protein
MCAFSTILGVLVAMLVHLLTQLLVTFWGMPKTCEHIRIGFLLVVTLVLLDLAPWVWSRRSIYYEVGFSMKFPQLSVQGLKLRA